MLPAPKTRRFRLADVFPSCVGSLSGRPNPLGMPPVDHAVVLLVDGLGTRALAARAGHARSIAPLVGRATTIDAGFPTTTASSLATLTTGQTPGRHGLVGYSVLDPARDRVVNQLSGWDDDLDPATWQRSATVFESAADIGVSSIAVSSERYRHSGFTRAVLRGAHYRSGETMADRADVVRDILGSGSPSLVYLYVPELDAAAHAFGIDSPEWTHRLEELDSMVAGLTAMLGRRDGLLLTADHGVLDVPASSHVLFDQDPGLVDGIRHVAGEPRCLQLHLEPGLSAAGHAALLERWRLSESSRSWVASRTEAIEAGWFGDSVDVEVLPRIGDIIVAARARIAYYDSRAAHQNGRKMIGQHGSFSPEETSIPLLRYGAFAA
jgi:predicted AlkP superfamily pyrophosphatase or phosphodiesterase